MTAILARVRALEGASRAGAFAGAVLGGWILLAALLPSGLPVGVVLLGLVLGGLSSLTATGLVLVHRSTRIVNFAQAEIGGLAAAVAVLMVVGERWPYFVALPIGLAVALATGALIDVVVVRRFFTAPRLILTVATIGLTQLLAGLQITLPRIHSQVAPLTTFTTPFDVQFRVAPIVFTGDHLVAMLVVPAALGGLAWFLNRSATGIAVRAAAESGERALLLGIPVRRLSTITWTLAAGLSGVGAMLSAPIVGPSLGALAGPDVLLVPLAAAVLARMESVTVAFVASLGIGVLQQAVFWSYPRSSTVDVVLLVLVLLALLVRRREARAEAPTLEGHSAFREVRPVPGVLARLPEVRMARLAGMLAVALIALVVPLGLSHADLTLAAFIAIYGIVAVSLVVLTGWAGQVSLGQFAFVGLGAATTGTLVTRGVDLFVGLLLAAAAGGMAAVVVGLPALRIRGLLLAVATLAFAVPVSTFLLNSAYFPSFTPHDVERPPVLQRFDLDSDLTFYYFCLSALVLALLLARNFRRSRAGRTVVAVRDNERSAASFAISPVRAKLTAFAFSGALAGFAGGLYVLGVRGIGFAGFAPVKSVEVFTMVVVGGLGSLPGAMLGAAYVRGVESYLHGGPQLLATGAGLLLLLMIVPGGLGEVLYGTRDRLLRAVARRRGIEVSALVRSAGPSSASDGPVVPPGGGGERPPPLLLCDGIDAGYGKLQVLFGAGLDVREGEVLALLGTNGAGKSTLLRVVAGILRPAQGRVVLDGRDITDLDPIARLRAGIVTVPGGRGVFGSLTVAENLRLAGWLRLRQPEALARDHDAVLDLFPVLRLRAAEKAASLSGGEQQMLTIAQALLCRPRVLMVDELSLGLAPTVVGSLLDVLRDLNGRGTTIVLVEQSLNVAATVAARAAFMEKGEVRFEGPTAELMRRPDLVRSVFLGNGSLPGAVGRRRTPASTTAEGLPSEPAIEVVGITRRFGGVTAVDGVDLAVPRGTILGLIGANGAGKTTLFDVCSGFLTADRGRVCIGGADVTALPASARADLGLGRSAQDARLFPALTVAETVAVALDRHVDVREPVACTLRVRATAESEAAVAARVDEVLEQVGLEPYRDAFVGELSTGMRRILDLACALAHRPDVLLLDEPSSGIAQGETGPLGALLVRVKDDTGATLVVIEHDIPLVSSIADELVCLHLGRVIARGAPADVLADPAVVAAYLGTDERVIARSGRSRRRPLVATGRS